MDIPFRHGRLAGAVLVTFLLLRPVIGQEQSDGKTDGTQRATSKRSPAEAGSADAEAIAPARPAVDKGLKFLATQQLEDGSFSTSGYGRNAAVVALAGMAWLSNGSTPGRGPYGEEVSRVTDFLLDHANDSGFVSVEGA